MAESDIVQLRHGYSVAGEQMVNVYHYSQEGFVPGLNPLQLLCEQWLFTKGSLLREVWGERCKHDYVYARTIDPHPTPTYLLESSEFGLVDGDCLPTASTGRIAWYTHYVGRVWRGTTRIGGIAESLAANGSLTTVGEGLLDLFAQAMMERVPYTGSSTRGWYPGHWVPGPAQRGLYNLASAQVRSSLGTQRTRIRRAGSRG